MFEEVCQLVKFFSIERVYPGHCLACYYNCFNIYMFINYVLTGLGAPLPKYVIFKIIYFEEDEDGTYFHSIVGAEQFLQGRKVYIHDGEVSIQLAN